MVKKKLYKPIILKQPSKPICYSLYISSKHVPITDKTKAPLILYDYYYEKNDNGSYCIYNKNNVKLNREHISKLIKIDTKAVFLFKTQELYQ